MSTPPTTISSNEAARAGAVGNPAPVWGSTAGWLDRVGSTVGCLLVFVGPGADEVPGALLDPSVNDGDVEVGVTDPEVVVGVTDPEVVVGVTDPEVVVGVTEAEVVVGRGE
jgi:hypothetical protein